ncbi:MAG: cation-translocating P-type ATPase C-terminal domain-containing protein, partial [Oscillospiraceae bacterium]
PPRKSNESVFSNGLAMKIVFRGILIGLTTLASFSIIFSITKDENIARTSALFALIFTQLIHVFECKSEEKNLFSIHYFNNIKLILATLFSLITLLLVIYVPFLQGIFCTVSLSLSQILIIIGLCFIAPLICCIFQTKKH